MARNDSPDDNALLAALSSESKKRILPALRRLQLPLGAVLHETYEHIADVFFPIDCIISLVNETTAGQTTEICVVGREGFIDIAVVLGADRIPSRAVVQNAGTAYCLPAGILRREFETDAHLRAVTLGYLHNLMTQIMQSVICNRHHTILQQLARWLLMSLDRLSGNELHMTQELISAMLGVRREAVTEAARKLKKEGIIDYRRGHITVLDRRRLEQVSCECYQLVKAETEQLYARLPRR